MRLFIAEKPELAKAIVAALGGGRRQDGYIDCGSDKVTWCFGHMLSLYDPEDYDPQYKQWKMEHLPVVHTPWKKKISADKKKQVSIIKGLLKQAHSVVHAGDPDEEGQLLVDELLEYLGCQVPVKRILINDNNTQVVKKSLTQLRSNSEFAGLSASAEARSVADQLYGYNMTRMYTLAAQQKGHQGVLSVGRVQTPILGMVVRRDRLNAAHQKSLFYTVKGTFTFLGPAKEEKKVTAVYQVQEGDPADEKNRLSDKTFAETIATHVTGKEAVIKATATKDKKQSAPLPYNLLKLQADASRKFNLKPDQVLSITQSLREKHKLITYNRSDCEYLSDEQHKDACSVLVAIAGTASALTGAAKAANPSFKSKAFNSRKVSAHHGIVPTQTTGDFSQLSVAEQKIYLLIARAYVAQFFPLHQYQETKTTIECEQHPVTGKPLQFSTGSKVTIHPGWQVLYKNDKGNDEINSEGDTDNKNDLRALQQGQQGQCQQAKADEKETKPPALYTMSSLLKDLTRTAKYIEDPALRKLLQDKDKDKAGEHGGIGTPATRSTIIKNLFDRRFLTEKGKYIIPTPLGSEFFDLLPDKATRPDMTALWHEQQKDIKQGVLPVNQFIGGLVIYLQKEVAEVKTHGLDIKVKGTVCPQCNTAILGRRKGKKGFFWGCSAYPECKALYPDQKGKPALNATPKTKLIISSEYQCKTCGKGLIKRTSKKNKKLFFWGCSGFPLCKTLYFDKQGQPDYDANKTKKREVEKQRKGIYNQN